MRKMTTYWRVTDRGNKTRTKGSGTESEQVLA